MSFFAFEGELALEQLRHVLVEPVSIAVKDLLFHWAGARSGCVICRWQTFT